MARVTRIIFKDGRRREVDEADWSIPFEVRKVDEDQQLVFGWSSISTVDGDLIVDKQGDQIGMDELEPAAYEFVLNTRQMGDMHAKTNVGRLVESMVFSVEKQRLLGIDLGMTGWWTGFRVDDMRTWALVKAGARPMFSIGGRAMREDA
jgi:hypothetical protein